MGCPGGDLGKRFDLDAGDGAGERRQQLASIEVVICQLELTPCLVELRPGAEQCGPRLVEHGLRRDASLQAVLPCAGNPPSALSSCAWACCTPALACSTWRLQRARVDLRQHVAQLHLLADGQGDRLQLAADFERETADVGRLQDAGKTANAAFGLLRRLCRPADRAPAVRSLPAFFRRSLASRPQAPLRSQNRESCRIIAGSFYAASSPKADF